MAAEAGRTAGLTLKAGRSGHAERLRRMPLLVGSMDSFCPVPTEGHGTGVTAAGGSDQKPTQRRGTRGWPELRSHWAESDREGPQKGHAGEAPGEGF